MNDLVILKICIYKSNSGKYGFVMKLLNGGAVPFGPLHDKKKDAEKFLSSLKKSQPFAFDEGFAAMHTIIKNIHV